MKSNPKLQQKFDNLVFFLEFFETDKNTFHLDYQASDYRQENLATFIRENIIYHCLTEKELDSYFENPGDTTIYTEAANRISNRPKDKKGDYGEFLLFLLLHYYYKKPKLITKIKIKTSGGDEVKGFDCAHFTLDSDKLILWLGEAKFYKDFSSGLNNSIKSIKKLSKLESIENEISIIKSHIDNESDNEKFQKIKNIINSGISLDKIHFKIPVLLTYDCDIIKKYSQIDDNFKQELKEEVEKFYGKISKRKVSLASNFSLLFILFPFKDITNFKSRLEEIERGVK